MHARAKGIVFALALTAAAPARALTGAELLASCHASIERAEGKAAAVDPYKAGQCLGYVQGFGAGADVAALGASRNMAEYRKNRVFCVPPRATNLSVMRVVVDALRDQPAKRLQQDARTTVGLALRRAFPCK